MYEDTMKDMDSNEEIDTPTDDSGVLTGDQVRELATMQPLLVYEQDEDKKVKVAILEGLRTFQRPTEDSKPPRFSIRIQGVRKGELTYNAKRTINELSLVPVLALMDAELVDRMRVSPEALALGKAAIDPAPVSREFVDMVVEDYVEVAPIEREFFLPSEERDDYPDTLPISEGTLDMPTVEEVMAALGTTEPVKGLIDAIEPGFYGETLDSNDSGLYSGTDTLVGNGLHEPMIATYADPTASPNFTGTITFDGYIEEQLAVNTQQLDTVEQVVAEPALIEDREGTVHVSDNLDASVYQSPEALTVHPDRSPSSDLVDTTVEPMVVPGQGATAYSIDPTGLPVIETEVSDYPGQYTEPLSAVGVVTTAEWHGAPVSLEPGVQDDGTTVPFDPAVHQLPVDQLPM